MVNRIVLEVPFIKGKKYDCSEACFSMLMAYYGIDIKIRELKAKGCYNFETMKVCFPRIRSRRIPNRCYNKKHGTIKKLIQLIQKGTPVLLRIKPNKEYHTIIIVGYDLRSNIIIYHESQRRPNLNMSIPHLKKVWQYTNNSFMYCK